MRSTTSSGPSGAGGSKAQGRSTARSRGSQQGGRINRAQVRAMQARAASAPPDSAAGEMELVAANALSSRHGAAAISRRRPIARPVVLSREQEYKFIQRDMHRLLIIAGGLFLLMLVLLFILD